MIVKFSSDTAMAEFTEALDYHGIPFDCQGATVHLIAPNDATLTLADALGGAVVKDDGFVDTAAYETKARNPTPPPLDPAPFGVKRRKTRSQP